MTCSPGAAPKPRDVAGHNKMGLFHVDSDGTQFSYNSAHGGDGDAIYAHDATISSGRDKTFRSNVAKKNGGALAEKSVTNGPLEYFPLGFSAGECYKVPS
eukprot:g7944.t1